MSARTHAIALSALLVLVALLSNWLSGPPEVIPRTASASLPSAERAARYVDEIAQRPHPVGSADHDRVRDFIVGELRALGLAPQVQRATGFVAKHRTVAAVENIVARIAGTSGERAAVLLACHYDSVPAGPGAGDDAAGVAAVLEAVRALRAGPPLENDLVILISDGEEPGLAGASAFMEEHPWARDVRVALNFEARGNRGPSVMFQTSPDNGALVSLLASAGPRVAANSLSYEVYRRMPNDTDMTVFLEHGVAGLNFAFIGGWEAYHTPLDRPDRLDPRSLQQHASYALSLARALGDADLSRLRSRDAVYFSMPCGIFVHYSSALAWPVAAAVIMIWIVVAAWSIRGRAATASHVLLAALLAVAVTVLSVGLGAGFVGLVSWDAKHVLGDGDVLRSAGYASSLSALTVGLWLGAYAIAARRMSWTSLATGSALVLVVMLVVSTATLVGTSYLFAVPAVMTCASIAVAARGRSTGSVLALALLAVPAVAMSVPHGRSLFEGLGLSAMGAPALAVATALACGGLLPQLAVVIDGGRRAAVGVPIALGLGLFAFAALTTHYDADHPKPSVLVYARDADTGRARWASSATRLDPWTRAVLGNAPSQGPVNDTLRYSPSWLQAAAPDASLTPPELSLVTSAPRAPDPGQAEREIVVLVRSTRHATELLLLVQGQTLLRAAIDGHDVPWSSRPGTPPELRIRYVNLADEGVSLKLVLAGSRPVTVVAIDGTLGLPDIPGHPIPPRGADAMQNHWGDQTTVRTARTF